MNSITQWDRLITFKIIKITKLGCCRVSIQAFKIRNFYSKKEKRRKREVWLSQWKHWKSKKKNKTKIREPRMFRNLLFQDKEAGKMKRGTVPEMGPPWPTAENVGPTFKIPNLFGPTAHSPVKKFKSLRLQV